MTRYNKTGTVSTVPQINTELEKIAEAIDSLLARDGDRPNHMGASLDMNNNELLNLPFPTTGSSPVRLRDLETYQLPEVQIPPTTFNVVDYGAVGDGITDNYTAFKAAIDDIGAAGGGVLYIPRGVFRVGTALPLVSNMTVRGEGYSSCIKSIYDEENDTANLLFLYISPTRPELTLFNIFFDSVRLEQVWDEVGRELGTNSLITIVGVDTLIMDRCWMQNSNYGCIVTNQSNNVHIRNSFFKDCARDVTRLWGTFNSSIIGCTFLRNDDDCISYNTEGFETFAGVMRDGLFVIGNYFRDTGSINMMVPKNCVISNNIMKLCKGAQGIVLSGKSTEALRDGNIINTIVENNIIVDLLDRFLAVRPNPDALSQNLRVGIYVTQGVYTTTELEDPYEYQYTDSGAAAELPFNQNNGVFIRNNIVKRSIQGTSIKYSDMGFGPMFSRFEGSSEAASTDPSYFNNGYVDPDLRSDNFHVRPLEIRDGLVNATIENNFFQGSGDKGIYIHAVITAARDFSFRNLSIKNNIIRDFKNDGIDLASYSDTEQDIMIQGNIIDGDPYFNDGARGTNGEWLSSTSCVGIDMDGVRGIQVVENLFRNCSLGFRIGSSNERYNVFRANTFEGEPSTTDDPRSFNNTNKGMGVFSWREDPDAILSYVSSDPQDPNYGYRLPKQVSWVEGVSPPTVGYYFRGQVVNARLAFTNGDPTLLGYKRVTNGNQHVLGVDWVALYADTSNTPVVSSNWTATGNTISVTTGSSVGATYIGSQIQLLNNTAPATLHRYTSYVSDGTTTTLDNDSVFVNSVWFDDADGTRWVAGDAPDLVEQFDNSWVSTGVTISIANPEGIDRGDGFYWVIDNVGVIHQVSLSTYNATGVTINTGLTNTVGIAVDGSIQTILVATSDGDIYSVQTDGTGQTLELSTGLTNCQYITRQSGTTTYLIGNTTTAVEYTRTTPV